MLKYLFIGLISAVFTFGAGSLSFAQDKHNGHGTEVGVAGAVSQGAVNVGNKICPVSGEKIDEKLKATYEYQGKIYNFCCAGCIPTFKNNPDRFIKIVNEELSRESEASGK